MNFTILPADVIHNLSVITGFVE